MQQSKCKRRHYHDPSEHPSCPHCALNGDSWAADQQTFWPESRLENARGSRHFRAFLGAAPDGLPWHLIIDRGPLTEELLGSVANEFGLRSLGDGSNTPMRRVAQSLQDALNGRDFASIDVDGEHIDCHVTNQPIQSLIGPTLLERLMGAPFQLSMPLSPGLVPFHWRGRTVPTGGDFSAARLAIPLNGDPPVVVRQTVEESFEKVFKFVRRFSLESLGELETAYFWRKLPYEQRDPVKWPISDLQAYREQILNDTCADVPMTHANVQSDHCFVDRAEVLQLLAHAADQLNQLHLNGKIHGDLKPSNFLITSQGIQVIDSLDLEPSVPSTAMTPAWAAPEQRMGAPIFPPRDQYSLGLLISTLVGGRMEEPVPLARSIITGPTRMHRTKQIVDPAGIQPWLMFLDCCLRFDATQRYSSMGDLAGELRDLLAQFPPKGQLSMKLSFGALSEYDRANKVFGWLIKQGPRYVQGVRVGCS